MTHLSKLGALVCALGLSASAYAQSTTVTGSNLKTGGVAIATGTVTITPTNGIGTDIPFVGGDGSVNSAQPFSAIITNGFIAAGFVVPDQALALALTPNTPLYYRVTVTNSANKLGYSFLLSPGTLTGSTWALDGYKPTQTAAALTGFAVGTVLPASMNCAGASRFVLYSGQIIEATYSCVNNKLLIEPAGTGGGTVSSDASAITTGVMNAARLPTIDQLRVNPAMNAAFGGTVGTGGNSTCPQPATGYYGFCVQSTGLMYTANGAAYIAFTPSNSSSSSSGSTTPSVAATPTASPAAGSYSGSQTVTLTTTTSGATIYYTVDGSTPTTGSSVYGGPMTLNSSITIKAFAHASGYTDSAVATFAYTITAPAQTSSNFSTTSSCEAGGTSCTLTSGAGDVIAAFISNVANGTVTMTDSAGGTFTLVKNINSGTDTMFVLANASAGSHTVSFTSTGGTSYPVVRAVSLAGASTTAPVDVSNGGKYTGVSQTYTTASSVTTTGANRFVVYGLDVDAGCSSSGITPASGYTSLFPSDGAGGMFLAPANTAGTYAPGATLAKAGCTVTDVTLAVK